MTSSHTCGENEIFQVIKSDSLAPRDCMRNLVLGGGVWNFCWTDIDRCFSREIDVWLCDGFHTV